MNRNILKKRCVLVILVFIILIASSIQLFYTFNFEHNTQSDFINNGYNTIQDKNLVLENAVITQSRSSGTRNDIRYWATFQFDYHNTGNTSGKAPMTNNTLWKFKCKGEIYGSPVVVGDSVYFTATDKNLYCIDLENGTENWRFDLEQNSYATPTVFGGYVYVGSGTDTANSINKLFCINCDTGIEAWSYVVDGPVISPPIVINREGSFNDRVYFGTVKDNKIYSVDLATHLLDWEYPVENGGNGGSDGIWGSLAYYNVEDGWLLYSVNSESFNPGETRGLFCIQAIDHMQRWQFIPDEGSDIVRVYSSPTIFKNKVLVGTGVSSSENVGKLHCLDINNGETLWNFTVGDGDFGYGIATSPAIAYDKIIFGSCDGKLYALDLNGNELWNYSTGDTRDGIYSSPSVADNKVYFGSCDNVFYCLNVHNGSLIWKYDLSFDGPKGTYGVVSAPAIAYNKVLVGGNNGYLYCFGSSGKEPPVISIKNPVNNQMVSGNVKISGISDDDVEVVSVQVKIDDGGWFNTSSLYSWTHDWDTTKVENGPHTLYARAFDKDGFMQTNITVIVNNGEGEVLLLIKSHTPGQNVSGTTKFYGFAYHSTKTIKEVQINIDNSGIWDLVTGTTNWHFLWDTSDYIDGDYFIQFRAFDSENYSKPVGIMVHVSNLKDLKFNITPMFRSDRNRMGVYNSSVPNATEELWNFTSTNQIWSSAIYYNDKIYFGSEDYFIYCLDSETGQPIWKYETANKVDSTPVIADKKLYVGSHDYYMYCLNAQTGEFLWRTRTGGDIDSSPLVLNDTLYFGSYDGKVYCVNTSDGAKRWTFETGDEVWGSPGYWEGCIYIGSIDGRMYCLWANNGTERWNYSSNLFVQLHGVYSTPTIVDGKVIFGSEDTFLYCVDSATGDLIWKFKTTGYIYSSPAVNNSKVFFSSLEDNDDGVLYAIPLNDPNSDLLISPSEVLWKFPTHDFDGGSSPVVSTKSGLVLIGSNAYESGGVGFLFCIDEETGYEVWNITLSGDIIGTPLLANDRVYIGSLDERMYCFAALGEKPNETNGGNGNANKSQIVITIEIPTTEVLSGHAIEKINFIATTENGTPIPQAWFTFLTTKGSLSQNRGTAFEDGSYNISYIAPKTNKITIVTLTATAERFGFLNGSNFIQITINPLPKDSTDGDDDKDEDSLLEEVSKPKYYYLWIIISVLIILTILIFTLLLTTRRKLQHLENGLSLEDEMTTEKKKKTKVKGKLKDKDKSKTMNEAESKGGVEERIPPPELKK
jgi:outer membrane protein assembly factor BamB